MIATHASYDSKMRLCIALVSVTIAVTTANAAPPLLEFTESGGCKLRGTMSSVARLKEIATQGKVAWQGACVGGYIDGPGVLWHEGSIAEGARNRRFVFLLAGNARTGLRSGAWTRESFNMFGDSSRYWTSVATINYVNGAAKGPTIFREARDTSDFSPPFREFLAKVDAEVAAAGKPAPGAVRGAAPTEATKAPHAVKPAGTTRAAMSPPAPTPAPGPDTATTSGASAVAPSLMSAQLPTSAAKPVQSASPPETSEAIALAAPAPSTPPVAAARISIGPELRESHLQPLAEPGRPLPPPAPPPMPQQQLLQQLGACNIEQINGELVREYSVEIPALQAVQVIGWATDPHKSRNAEPPRIPEEAWLRFYDRGGGPGLLVNMPRNSERPDVARALGHPAHAKAGFRVTVEPGRLQPGEYSVAILQRIGTNLAVCSSTARLRLK